MPSGKRNKPRQNKTRAAQKARYLALSQLLTRTGFVFIAASFTLVIATLWPVMFEEVSYTARHIVPNVKETKPMVPIDTDFGIVIPKIEANAKVVPNVDPVDSRVYQVALTQGVAHAKGTATPGSNGNIFLFSHSSVNFYEAARYNSVFYLLTKLEKGDEIDLYYYGTKYVYRVSDKRTVFPTAVEYLHGSAGQETVTLMTCWPPGTTYKRLLVIAERIP